MSTGKRGNLINDALQRGQETYALISPVTGEVVDQLSLASRADIEQALSGLSAEAGFPEKTEIFRFLDRLKREIERNREVFFEKTYLETGFIESDAREAVDSTIEFLDDFEIYTRESANRDHIVRHSYSHVSQRDIRLMRRPFRCVAAVVPQNASLTLGIVIMASALFAGARVILRPSLQCGATGALLAEAVMNSNPPRSCVAIVNCLAHDFLESCYRSDCVDLIHYIGSNQYALSVFTRSFESGKMCLLDGQGNGLLYVDGSFPVEDAARLIVSGATRYNGETCTSVNGVLADGAIYRDLKDALVDRFSRLRVGHPMDEQTQVGPLFSAKQAAALRESITGGEGHAILCGGKVDRAFFEPAVVENVRPHHRIVREGFFGPAVWMAEASRDDIWGWLKQNRFPLSDTILSNDQALIDLFALTSHAARICVNEDPSVESMFEPWGGYPPSGLNPVSMWIDKYRHTFQMDGRLKRIMMVGARRRNC